MGHLASRGYEAELRTRFLLGWRKPAGGSGSRQTTGPFRRHGRHFRAERIPHPLKSVRLSVEGSRSSSDPRGRILAAVLIGEVARRASVSVQAIRLYERSGILPPCSRSASGYRQFTERHVEVLGIIRQLKRFGSTLAEIREVLALFAVPDGRSGKPRYARGSDECLRATLEMGARKLAAIDKQIARLSETRDELRQLMERFRAKLTVSASS